MSRVFFSPVLFAFLKLSNVLVCSWPDIILLCIVEHTLRKVLVN